jgi:hypothetical protein
MKIALLFAGQPRFVEEVYPLIKQNVIGDYDVDVFSFLWEMESDKAYKYGGDGGWKNQRISENAIDTFTELYKPKRIETKKSINFNHSKLPFEETRKRYYPGSINNTEEPDFRNRTINNALSYFYSLNEVNRIKKEYEYENDMMYDWVVRCRTDSQIYTKIEFEKYNPNVINYSGNQNQPDGMINDWFDFGGSIIMDAFMSVFPVSHLLFLKCLHENNGAWCNELLHRKMIDLFGIQHQSHNINVSLPRF